jgi:condensin complex subunit 2
MDIRIPLNDDKQEKAVRFQSRQALHDLQLSQLKAAATPIRLSNNYDEMEEDSPSTPQTGNRSREQVEENGLLSVVSGNSMTPMKRVPILANFEEWMKMATDNKINAANSWNFALIDYFHDMSLLKEGDGVNFQKASCTLDGCVKIYTSRVDSVATETGKLLSGLADSGSKKQNRDGAEEGDENDEGESEGEDGEKRPKRKKVSFWENSKCASNLPQL